MAPRGRQNSNPVTDRSFLNLSMHQPWREKVVMHYVCHTARGDLEIGRNDSPGLGVVAPDCGLWSWCPLGKAKVGGPPDPLTLEASVACIVRARATWATVKSCFRKKKEKAGHGDGSVRKSAYCASLGT